MSIRNAFLFTVCLALAVALVGCKSRPQAARQQAEPLELPSAVTLNFDGLAQEDAEAGSGAGLDEVLVLVSDASAMNSGTGWTS